MRISDWSSDVCSSDLHLQDVGELLALDEGAAVPTPGEHGYGDGAETRAGDRQADVGRTVTGFRTVLRPAHAEPDAVHQADAADEGHDPAEDECRRHGRPNPFGGTMLLLHLETLRAGCSRGPGDPKERSAEHRLGKGWVRAYNTQ